MHLCYPSTSVCWYIEISIKHFKFADVLLEKGDFDMAYIFIIFC